MRLQLATTIASIAMAAGAQAQPREPGAGQVSSKLSVYTDDDATTVKTTSLDGTVGVASGLEIGAHVLVDAVSSASVDVVSAATNRWTESRIETGGRVTKSIRSIVDLGLTYVHSQENDWRSHSVQGTLGKDFFAKNTRVDLGYGYTGNQVGRANDPNFEDELAVHSLQLGLTQIIDAKTLLSATYSAQLSSGYHASPYRFVRLGNTGVGMPESHPTSRRRQALTFRALRSLHRRVALDGSYRIYGDDWGIVSHTATVALRFQPLESVVARIRVRGYTQGQASFYREQYMDAMTHMTSDRELSKFWDLGTGVKVRWTTKHFDLDLKVDVIRYTFLNFARLAERLAIVADVGAAFKW